MAKTRSKRRSESQEEDLEIETKVDDNMLDEDDGSSSDEAPEMVVQSDAKEIEKRRMEMENLQRAREEEMKAKRKAKQEEKKRKRAEALSLDVLEALEGEEEEKEDVSADEIVEPKMKQRENTIIRFERDGFTIEVDPTTGKTQSQKMHIVNAALDSDATCSTAVDFMSRHFSTSRLRRGYNPRIHSMTTSKRRKLRRQKTKK